MRLDLRIPIGALFAVTGFLIGAYGLVAAPLRDGVNVDLWWGLVMLATGLVFLALARPRRS